MEGQGRRPQHRPDVVAVAAVGQLMAQDVAQQLRFAGRRRGQIDRGPREAVQAGGGQPAGHVDRYGHPRNGVGPPHPPQAQIKAQVARQQGGGQHPRAAQPHRGQNAPPVRRPGGRGVRRGRRAGGPGFRLPLRPDGHGLRLRGGGTPAGLGRLGLHRSRLGQGHIVQHAQSGLEHRARHQKAQEHQQPQGVPQPQAHPPPEQGPHGQHNHDQQGRHQNPLSHAPSPPVPSKRRRGRRSPPGSGAPAPPRRL